MCVGGISALSVDVEKPREIQSRHRKGAGFGFVTDTETWHLEEKVKDAQSADCLGFCLAAYFCPSPTFSSPIKEEIKIRYLACLSLVLEESLLLS